MSESDEYDGEGVLFSIVSLTDSESGSEVECGDVGLDIDLDVPETDD
jgi:hypothetical protein